LNFGENEIATKNRKKDRESKKDRKTEDMLRKLKEKDE